MTWNMIKRECDIGKNDKVYGKKDYSTKEEKQKIKKDQEIYDSIVKDDSKDEYLEPWHLYCQNNKEISLSEFSEKFPEYFV